MMFAFLSGAIMMGCLACGLFFLRFWRQTRDERFLWFAVGFGMLALERVGLMMVHPAHELRPYVHVFSLLAFLMISVAIVRKNRRLIVSSLDG